MFYLFHAFFRNCWKPFIALLHSISSTFWPWKTMSLLGTVLVPSWDSRPAANDVTLWPNYRHHFSDVVSYLHYFPSTIFQKGNNNTQYLTHHSNPGQWWNDSFIQYWLQKTVSIFTQYRVKIPAYQPISKQPKINSYYNGLIKENESMNIFILKKHNKDEPFEFGGESKSSQRALKRLAGRLFMSVTTWGVPVSEKILCTVMVSIFCLGSGKDK